MVWTGRILSTLAVLLLLMDASLKIFRTAPSMVGTMQLGYSSDQVPIIGFILLACVVIYVIPRTSVLGAILLTGYLGGAVASQFRIGHPLLSQTLFPVYVAVLLWLGLFLRDERLRRLFPIREQ